MKVRMGFVSNSSTSSYMIMGFESEYGELNFKEAFVEEMFNNPAFMEKIKGRCECHDYTDPVTTVQELKECIDCIGIPSCEIDGFKTDVEISHNSDYDEMYVGIDLHNMGDNETRNEFRIRAYQEISKMMDVQLEDINMMCWAWFNG